MSTKVGFVYDEIFLEHMTPAWHPERPQRLLSIAKHLKGTALWKKLIHLHPARAQEVQLSAVHTKGHIDHVRSVCEAGGGVLDDGDTLASSRSFDAALMASGAVLSAVDAVISNRVASAFCAVRPPGHHAERDRAMGYCLFNNVAIGARHAQEKHGIERVAILDWDVHHGNGTQHVFEDNPSVLFISLHQYPYYPGTGARNERGIGPGEGYTLNFPFPEGTGEDRYLTAFHDEIVPVLRKFQPGLLMISAGFDAHKDDPLGGMLLDETSYGRMTALVREIAPVVSVLEGGYALEALSRSVETHLRTLMGD